MNQPHTTLAASGGAGPLPTMGFWPHLAAGLWPRPAEGALMRIACATSGADPDPGTDPSADAPDGLPSESDLDTSAVEPLAIAALGQTPSGLEVWTPVLRSGDSLNLLGGPGVVLVGVNELGWVVYDWVPGP
ncbi:MAG: hypothetical protein ACKOFK_01915 [Betaproteobacteria bacterium]